ncbi:MAG: F0F1 ATP synthase subunit A [Anaerolineaceae bacterium]|jgi:F-type H+-transporting ATPase subunit a|nr:F0F1 ATP synthase subunit A [Anaerolineaceae bacterium]
MNLNEAQEKKKKHSRKLAWLSIGAVVVFGFVFSLMNPPVRPTISLAAERLTEQPLFGNVYLTNTMVTMVLVDAVVLLLALATRRMVMKNKGHVPAGGMGMLEAVYDFIYGLTEKTAGKKWVKTIFPFFAIIFIYVLAANLMEIIPGMESIGFLESRPDGEGLYARDLGFLNLYLLEPVPAENGYGLVPFTRTLTTDINFTMGLAIFSMVSVQVIGFKSLGGQYFTKFFNFKQLRVNFFKGVIDVFVGFLELISEFAKIISFTFRLFGNVFAGMVILIVIGTLVPMLPVQSIFLVLELFFGTIQALVFGMLTMVFMSMAVHSHSKNKENAEEAE